MKFTKSFLAVAIAGIAAAPMMASATTTLTGVVEVQLEGNDSDDAGPFSGTKDGDAQIGAGDVLLGVTSEQALNNGLTGYGSLRYDLNTTSGGEFSDADSVYVGVKGGFGDLRLGETGNPGEYGQINDILTDMGQPFNQAIGYTGTFGGATVGVAYSPERDDDLLGVGAKFAWQGLSIGVGMQQGSFDTRTEATEASVGVDDAGQIEITPATPAAAGDAATNISAKVGFAYAGASIALGYAVLGDAIPGAAGETDDETAIVANVGYTISGITLGLTYDAQTESEDNQVRLDASYALGGGLTLSSRVNIFTDGVEGFGGDAEKENNEDKTDWRIRLSKLF